MIRVEVFSDVICPWCYVGGRRLARAATVVADRAGVDVRVRYRAFELNPGMPTEGTDRRTYRSAKFGSWEHSQRLDAHTSAAAADDGLTFDYASMTRTPNTRRAHRLVAGAHRHGERSAAMADRLFGAYFTEGQDIGNPAVLTRVAADVGLDPVLAATFLDDHTLDAAVDADVQAADRLGVRGVPFIVANGHAISGAGSIDDLVTLLTGPNDTPSPEALACGLDDNGCAS
jgi:predicted DsbA family dithiol-disulfide isomerase